MLFSVWSLMMLVCGPSIVILVGILQVCVFLLATRRDVLSCLSLVAGKLAAIIVQPESIRAEYTPHAATAVRALFNF